MSIRLNRKKNQGSYISANSDTVIVNSMNILRCVNKKDYRLLNLVKDPALNFKLQYELKNKSIYIITF